MNYLAQGIINPVINPGHGTGGTTGAEGRLADVIVLVWQMLLLIGGLAVLAFFIMGGIAWLTAGGDKTKVEEARNRITNAFIGLALLVGAMAIIAFVSGFLGLNILELALPNNLNSEGPLQSNPPFSLNPNERQMLTE